jgi:dynactin complex subunit
MTPDKILRNLENGYFMTHVEQEEAANYIRALQESNRILQEGILKYLEELAAMRRELTQLQKEFDEN